MADSAVRKRTYVWTWAVLMCLTGLLAVSPHLNLHHWNTELEFAIATTKASLVVIFFMHLRYEKQKTIWIWAAVSAIWLTLLIVLTMGDYLTRGFLRVAGK